MTRVWVILRQASWQLHTGVQRHQHPTQWQLSPESLVVLGLFGERDTLP